MTLSLVRVEKIGDTYVPVCRYCDFVGCPQRLRSVARDVLANHETCGRHRRAQCRAAVDSRGVPRAAT